jgi:hypothetical protein
VAVRRRAWLDIAARLLPVLLPSEFPFALSYCTAAQDWQPAETYVRRRGTGCSLRLGLRLDIEVSVIGPDRHNEVVQEAPGPAQAERMRHRPNYILAAYKASGR